MARRKGANGTGNMYYDEKRKLYIYRVTVGQKEDGSPNRKPFSGKTQEIALDKYRDWERRGAFVSLDPDITMKDWADKWWAEYKDKVEPSTASTYKYTLKHIKNAFGKKKVHEMRAAHIEEYLEKSAQKYSKSQCGKLRTMLGQILRKAEANELINKNPVPLADRMNYRRVGNKSTSKKDAFSAVEVVALMKGLPDTRIGHSIKLMLGAGLSTQELLGLSSFDIAQDGSTVMVRRAVKLKDGSKMYIGDVKAEKRERTIDVPPSIRPSAIFLRENADGYIIKGKNKDMPLHPSTYRKFYRSAIGQVDGVRALTPHCCRHTYISHLEDQKTDFAVIQALAGQSTQAATISYIHPQSPAISAAVNSIETLLTGKTEKQSKEKKAVGTQLAHKKKLSK